jgi:hypothetical protein
MIVGVEESKEGKGEDENVLKERFSRIRGCGEGMFGEEVLIREREVTMGFRTFRIKLSGVEDGFG